MFVILTLFVLLVGLVKFVAGIWSFFFPSTPSPFRKRSNDQGPKPLVTDQKARDAVLKQSFSADKVPSDLDAIVIGSGAGGLSAATILAKAGKKVLVLEQHDQAGGCCHTFIEKGYEFDVGVHYLGDFAEGTRAQVVMDQLTDGNIQWAKLDSTFDEVRIGKTPNTTSVYPICWTDFVGKLSVYFPDSKDELEAYLKAVKRASAMNSTQWWVLPKILPYWFAMFLVKTGLINKLTTFFTDESRPVTEVIEEIISDPKLRSVLTYICGDYGVNPATAPFWLHAVVFNYYLKSGAYYPVGGNSEIAFHMIPIIERSGGAVFVRVRVNKILIEDGKVKGVNVTKGTQSTDIFAPLVISSAGVTNTFSKLLPTEIAKKSRYYPCSKEIGLGHGGFQIFVGLKGSNSELGLKNRNYWCFNSYDFGSELDNYLAQSSEEALNSDIPVFFLAFPSVKDPSWDERYPGKAAATIVTFANYEWFKEWKDENLKHRGDDYEYVKKILAEKIWNKVLLQFPHLEDKVEYFDIASPVTHNYYIEANRGEIYGLTHTIERFSAENIARLRPRTDIPGLYLTGQDILGGGVMGAIEGSITCCLQVLNRNLHGEIDKLIAKDKGPKKLE